MTFKLAEFGRIFFDFGACYKVFYISILKMRYTTIYFCLNFYDYYKNSKNIGCVILFTRNRVRHAAQETKYKLRSNWNLSGSILHSNRSEKLNKCHFTSLHDYHVVCSIHTTEHSKNIRTHSAFGKFRPSDNFRFRTTLIFIVWSKFEFFIILWSRHACFHHNICHHQIHKKIFKISFLALSGL